MKKIMMSLGILIMSMSVLISCSNDDENSVIINDDFLNIPDESFEAILIEKGIDKDGIINQKMLKAYAENVTVLELEFSSTRIIKDLTGIEGFVSLKKLVATQHEIKNIDLSSNVLLDTLYLVGNNITSIDLSNNAELVFVDIQSNLLTSITGLSNASNLKDLDLSWNYFEEFSIHNESLEVLHFSHNNLKSLNTDGAINLRNIFMPSNKLETVDFSTNTLLETLLLAGNNLQEISLENNVALTHLYISSNELKSMDVSKNLQLEDLRVDRNLDLTCIKIMEGQDIPSVSLSDYQGLNSNCI